MAKRRSRASQPATSSPNGGGRAPRGELEEAQETQAALSAILRIIGSAPGDLRAVLDAIAASAARLCATDEAVIWQRHGDDLQFAAASGAEARYDNRLPVDRQSVVGRAIVERRPIHVPDLSEVFEAEFPQSRRLMQGGYRSLLAVPMLRRDEAIGVIIVRRREVRPYSPSQIELLHGFADQAAIAIENARLFDETNLRNRDLMEALEQQTATSDVLRVIASSPSDLGKVLRVVAERAARLCSARDCMIVLVEGDSLRQVAHFGPIPGLDDVRYPIVPGMVMGRTVLSGRPVHVHDLANAEDFPEGRAIALSLGHRSIVGVPLVRDDKPFGALIVRRDEVRPFGERQIMLLQTFADEAAIAIENTRLFDEAKLRNRDLAESLEQQTATSDVLRVIASSPSDLGNVLGVVAERAARLCNARDGIIALMDGDSLRQVAHFGPIPGLEDVRYPIVPGMVMGRTVLTGRPVHVHDLASAEDFPEGRALALSLGHRSIVGVPLIRDHNPFGALIVRRDEVRPFSERQIALLQTFADEAAIAIENTRLFDEARARTQEVSEALERQTATAEVLTVISRSTTELQPVLDTIVATAVRLCQAEWAVIFKVDGGRYRVVASSNADPGFVDYMQDRPFRPDRGTLTGRVLLEGRAVQIHDAVNDPEYTFEGRALGRYRSMLGVPLTRNGSMIGNIALLRTEVRPFTDKQVELVTTFADQAVIAINNVELFEQVQARSRELAEALDFQTATGEVLSTIGRAPRELGGVLETMLHTAARLCRAEYALLFRRAGDGLYRLAAANNAATDYVRHAEAHPLAVGRGSLVGRVALERRTVHLPDCLADPDYTALDYQRVGQTRSMLGVPLMLADQVIGVIGMMRNEVAPFSQRQIELVTTFADQAVIAIENARLFDETQARSAELGEALEQQIATSDILAVISRSLTDAQPVFDAIVQSGLKLFPGAAVSIAVPDGDSVKAAAVAEPDPARAEAWRRRFPFPLDRAYMHSAAILDRRVIDIADVTLAPAEFAVGARRFLESGYRAVTIVPMMRGESAIGALSVLRTVGGPLSDKQRAILQTFADQAVIAINNVRLFEEVQARTDDLAESLRQQTATADVLKVISRSTFDLQTVLRTLLQSAVQLCEADQGTITRQRDGQFYRAEAYGFSQEFVAAVSEIPLIPDRGSASGRALVEGRIVHIPDIEADREFTFAEARTLGGFRTILAVPMMKEGVAIGVIAFTRRQPRPFSNQQIELVSTFADQAAIAIENVRLFESVETRTRELSRSLEELRAAQHRLVQTEKLASLGQLTAGIAHEIKNPLNFVNNFAALSVDLIDELGELLNRPELDAGARSELGEIATLLRENFTKVVHHGKRADSIVRNMLQHSRQGSGEQRPADINALVEESLNLAYHGARAEQRDFNVTLDRSLDPAAGQADLYPQEIVRVLLNIVSNGFYATNRRRLDGATPDYAPTIRVSTRDLGDRVEIRIRDNGIGMPADIKAKIFNPFFTTKPAGEGTGLGLSLSHDIVVKQHGGSIEVESEPGVFTEFRIVLPRRATAPGEAALPA